MYKKPQLRFFVVFAAFLIIFLVLGPAVAQAKSAYEGRYFIVSKSSIVRSLFGVQHEFKDGFTADLTSGEVWTLEKIFKVNVSPVPLYKVSALAAESAMAGILGDTVTLPLEKERVRERDEKPDSSVSWGVKRIYGGLDIKSTNGGKNIDVAVLDTGANTKHLDLMNRIKDCKDFTRGPFPRSACDDKNGHGTHATGIIAADGGFDGNGIWGVAPETNISVYKVCRNDGTCWADDVVAGIDYAADNEMNIISLSLGGNTESSLLENSIKNAYKKGVLMVAAAGNDGPEKGSIDWPAAYSEVVAVGALAEDLTVPDWSSRGVNDGDFVKEKREVDFAAPGVNIQSTWSDGAYRYLSGTSMAAPHVSGLAAKVWRGSSTSTRSYIQSISHDAWVLGDDMATGFGLPVLPILIAD